MATQEGSQGESHYAFFRARFLGCATATFTLIWDTSATAKGRLAVQHILSAGVITNAPPMSTLQPTQPLKLSEDILDFPLHRQREHVRRILTRSPCSAATSSSADPGSTAPGATSSPIALGRFKGSHIFRLYSRRGTGNMSQRAKKRKQSSKSRSGKVDTSEMGVAEKSSLFAPEQPKGEISKPFGLRSTQNRGLRGEKSHRARHCLHTEVYPQKENAKPIRGTPKMAES